jgi:hypothetical protein
MMSTQCELPFMSTGYVVARGHLSGWLYRVFFRAGAGRRFFYLRRSSTADKSGLPDWAQKKVGA